MIRSIVAASLRFRFIVVAISAAMLLLGIRQIPSMAVDVFPEFAPEREEIQTICLGLSAQEVEALVTVPLEQELNGVAGLDLMRSKSIADLSSIELLFKPGTDILRARQLVQERIATVIPNLPTWAAPPVLMPPVSVTGRFMKIGLSSKTISLTDMSMTAYWTIRARLLRVPGVANVAIWGERIKMPQVRVDPERMHAHDVSLNQVMEVTADALDVGILYFSHGAVIGTGGFIDTPNQRLGIRSVSPLVRPQDLAQVPISDRRKVDGTPLVLRDVADVVEDTWPLFGDAVINDGPGLMLVVFKYPWANTLQATRDVEAALAELRPGLPGLEIDSSIFRPADFIQLAFDNLTRALVLGCVLVMMVLAAFLFEWRTALISLVAIPLSLVAGGLVLLARGATLNTMILAGFVIAVGVVVDDAIIDVENIVRRLRQHRAAGSARSTASVILEASLEVRQAIIHATLIDAVVLVPVFFMGGVSGAFFQPMAVSYALAVLASMGVALTLTPVLCLMLLRKAPITRREPPLMRWLKGVYQPVLDGILHRPRPVFIATALIMFAGVAVLPWLGESLFPQFKERDFLMHWITKPGTSVAEERRMATRASRELRSIPGVRNFGSHIGQALLADEVNGVNFGENWISVDPAVDYDKTVAAIEGVVSGYPGLFHNVETYLNESIDEVLSGSKETFVVRIYGPDLKGIHVKADEVEHALAKIPGIVDLHVQLQSEVPEVQVTVNLAAAQRYGIKPGDVRRASATLLQGEEVGDVFRDGKAYDVNVWSTPETRHSLTSIRKLPIDTPGHGHVRLGDVADVRVAPAQSVIYRENDSRRIDVGGNVRGRDLGSVMDELEDRLEKVKFPLGYHAVLLGEYAERQAAQTRLFIFAAGAALGVFLILLASFENARLAVLGFLTLPSALVGGLLATYFTGEVISLGSLVGFLTVFGIAARNQIMLISHYQHLERYEGETFGLALAVRGGRERLSPILMTALATALALVPLVASGAIPGHEIEYPMAIVILGGLITSTLLNLFVVPSLYFNRSRRTEMQHAKADVQPMTQGADAPAPGSRTAVLVAEGLQKSYGPRQALRGLSFTLGAGRLLGFLGPNGAGKTTSIRILTTIMEPDAGQFTVDGISHKYPEEIRRRIGVLPETFGLPKQMTGIEYLTYFGQLYGRSARQAKQLGLELLDEVGLKQRGRSLVSTYSHGMRQRVGIARALINDPMVVFLDEPTLGLDPRGQQELLGLVKQIAQERSAGVILCSHLLTEVESVCDDVVILSSGEIVATGSVRDVIGRTERNVIRIRVPVPSLAESQRALGTIPAVRKVAAANGSTGWLRVELSEVLSDDHQISNAILETLIRARIPILSFEPEGGRLQDVFLNLTAQAIK